MDLSQVGTLLLVIDLIVSTSAQTVNISSEDRTWIAHDRKEHSKELQQLFDVVLPQRVRTGNDTSPPSDHYLRFTERRHNKNEIRYNITAFGKDYQLSLKPERRFIAPSFTVEHFTGNHSVSVPSGSDLSHCYYRGSVLGDPISSAVFDLCNGLRGAFKTRDSVYLVQPLTQNTIPGLDETDLGLGGKRHLIINHLTPSSQALETSRCGMDEEELTDRAKSDNGESGHDALLKSDNAIHRRAKRETIFQGALSYRRYVELLFTADKSMLDHYGSEFELKRYLQTVIGVVHDIFRDPKIGNSIEIVLTGIKILKNEKDLKITNDAKKSLRRFCVWQHKQNVASDSDPGHYDTAVLITRKNICRRRGNCETLGLAELGTMCKPERSCSIVEDNGLGVAFTIAHELGHVFNIGHDSLSRRCLGEDNGLHVMAPTLNILAKPWSWSSCSRQEITEFLEQGHDKCLVDKPQYQFKKSDKLAGEIYSPDMQCKLTYGKNSSLCTFKSKPCRRLWCAVKFPNGEGCRSHDMPWADGSPCGNEKWCIRGSCVAKGTHDKINGGWSPWSPFGPCSRTCGGGVTHSSRVCNNPSPSNGGLYCLGAKERFKSCNTQNCPEGSPNFREIQCATFNGKRGPKGSKWIPRYLRGRHQCQLICERVGGGGFVTAKAIDGTKCDEKKFDICVKGICMLAGCDNVLSSRTKLDECGVCGGDNSTCKRSFKTWYQKLRWGYNDVATLYPGYSSIIIEQITPEAEARHQKLHKYGDDNYLVLLDENYQSLLNGGYFIKSRSKITYEALGLQFTYSGSRSYPEYVKIDGKLTTKMYLQVLSVEEVLPPRITYSYLSPVKDPQRFIWDPKGPWSKCSSECQGWRKRKVICKRERDGLLVTAHRCDPKKKPQTINEHCNTDCYFKWVVAGKGACHPGCGPGSQKIYFNCIKHYVKSNKNIIRSYKDCKSVTRPNSEQPCMGLCDNVQWVYSRWSGCSKTCGGGIQTRRVTCVEKIAYVRKELPASMCSRIKKRPLQRTCRTELCPSWRTGDWSRCSVACGEGYQRRTVDCVLKGNVLTNHSACDSRRKPTERRGCRTKACPHWEYEEWSDCSATCGTGHEIRLVRCVDAEGKALKDEDCRTVQKPISRQRCRDLPPCDKTVYLTSKAQDANNTIGEKAEWTVGEWSECSVKCGTGQQERNISCVDARAGVLPDDRCKHITKPSNAQKCVRYCGNWRYSDWTPCSSGCGTGTQRRQVKCFNNNYRLTEDEMCDPLLRPAKTRQCTNYLCSKPKPKTSGRWKTGSWTKCSRTCEAGIKRRYVICLDGFSKRDYTQKSCPKDKKPASVSSCDLGPCPQWKAKEWSQCSKSCDLGTVSRVVYCSDNRSILKDEKCNRKLKPTVTKSCFVKTCVASPRWVKGAWNPCSVKCGEGLKKRQVWCQDFQGKRIPQIHCKSLRRQPKSVKKCRRNTCGVWEAGPWGDCSSQCEIGEKVRSVRCRKSSSFVSDQSCSSKVKPADRKPCLVRNCKPNRGQHKWFTTDWSPCTKTCGVGVKSRMVLCVSKNEVQVQDANCNLDTKPQKTVTCKIKECSPEWIVGDWSKCSKSCGEGVQTRSVLCPEKAVGSTNPRPIVTCDKEKKPFGERRCNLGFCDGYYTWKTGPWSRCSATCGEARMRRAVKCLGRNNEISPAARCLTERIIKPDSYKKCKVPQCVPKTCKDIQAQTGKQDDKEFILTINNKKIKVFCQGMLTDNPKEYITLSSGPNHNFAEYYHRSLRNPNQCPYSGARSDHCPHCHTEHFPSSGGTYFSKVRFDISRMSLIGNDFTFAERRGKHSPAFGTAGDCYSKVQCPQGRFSIDLTNTGLSLAPEVTWRSYGYHLSRIIEIQEGRQIVSGMCGGYCGVCRPYRSLRVAV